MHVRRRVPVEDPDEPALLRNGEIRIRVPFDEIRQVREALAHVAVEHHAAGLVGESREQDVVFAFANGGREAHRQRMDREAAFALVMRSHVLVFLRVVELFLVRGDEDRIVRQFAVVDFGLFDPDVRDLDDRRRVLDQQDGQALRGSPVHLGRHDAVAVRVDPVAVDPVAGFAGQGVHIDLARREQELLDLAVDLVAIDVHVREAVVEPQGLQLGNRVGVGLFVPQPDVVDQRRVGLDVQRGRIAQLEKLLLARVDGVGLPRGLDVAFDVLSLQLQFVRPHIERLDRDRRAGVQHEGASHQVSHGLVTGGRDEGNGEQEGDNDQPAQGQAPDLVQIVHADHEGVVAQQQAELAQIEPGGPASQRDAGEDLGEIRLRGARKQERLRPQVEFLELAPFGPETPELAEDLPAAAGQPEHDGADEGEREKVLDQEPEERQVEEVEGQIPPEDRIGPMLDSGGDAARTREGHDDPGIHLRSDEHDRQQQQRHGDAFAVQRVRLRVGSGERDPSPVRPEESQPGKEGGEQHGDDLVQQNAEPGRDLADFGPPQVFDGEVGDAAGAGEDEEERDREQQQAQLAGGHNASRIACQASRAGAGPRDGFRAGGAPLRNSRPTRPHAEPRIGRAHPGTPDAGEGSPDAGRSAPAWRLSPGRRLRNGRDHGRRGSARRAERPCGRHRAGPRVAGHRTEVPSASQSAFRTG